MNFTATEIENITLEYTGGACLVTFVHLKDGMIIGITDEIIAIYNSMEHFYEGECITFVHRRLPNGV